MSGASCTTTGCVGVVLFEQTQIRALLLVFPNTFDVLLRLVRGRSARAGIRDVSGAMLLIGIAAFIWIFIKLPQEWWIHVAELDATDLIKTNVFGVDSSASWTDAIAARPWVLVVVVAAVVALVLAARWVDPPSPAAGRSPVHARCGRPSADGRGSTPSTASDVTSWSTCVSLELLEKVVAHRACVDVHLQPACCRGADPPPSTSMVGRRGRGRARYARSVACSSFVATDRTGPSSSSPSRWLSTSRSSRSRS